MKTKILVTTLMLVVLLSFISIAIPAVQAAVVVVEETQITTDTDSQFGAEIYGNRIIWNDGDNLDTDIAEKYIYHYIISSNTLMTPILIDANYVQSPTIHGDIIAWTDYNRVDLGGGVDSYYDVYMFNLVTGTAPTTNPVANARALGWLAKWIT